MSNRTIPAGGGALPAEIQKTTVLIAIDDALDQVRDLIAAASNPSADNDAQRVLVVEAQHKLDRARAELAMIKLTARLAAKAKRLAALSFVAADGHRWHVKSTGDHNSDRKVGQALALEYLAYEESDEGGPGELLRQIVAAMPRDFTGVEMGFLNFVSWAAGAGAERARQIAAYWDRCDAEREAAKRVREAAKRAKVVRSARRAARAASEGVAHV